MFLSGIAIITILKNNFPSSRLLLSHCNHRTQLLNCTIICKLTVYSRSTLRLTSISENTMNIRNLGLPKTRNPESGIRKK